MSKLPLRLVALASLCAMSAACITASAAPFDSIESSREAPLATYQKVFIAPVEVTIEDIRSELLTARRRNSRTSRQQIVSEETKARKAVDLYEDLTWQFSRNFTIVDAPASDVLTISAEITNLISSRPTAEQQRRGVGQLVFNGSVAAGGADYIVTISSADEQIVIIEESYRSNLNDNIPRVGIWQDVDESFKKFSRQLARYVKNN